ncbi:MAG: DUF1987 domain-containing protein [Bacteroidia bacterium]|nr:DUF1987 domain-containing protein [Bacteroidia bacterium]MDW8235375.1 SiaC family regulatory phosphoprotein [Bacteroidia bacterium]
MSLYIAPSLHTPEVLAKEKPLEIVLRGVCFPEDSVKFFREVKDFFQKLSPEQKQGNLTMHVELSYVNSASQRELYQIIHGFLRGGGEVHLILYSGEEEEEMDDLHYIVYSLRGQKGLEVERRQGYYAKSVESGAK